jgi:hypothetical protein
MRYPLNWTPFFQAAAEDRPYRDRLRAYARIAHEQFETERFADFCATHLAHLDELTWEFFGTADARDAVHQKVSAIYPKHEVDSFTELFWSRIQEWRDREGRNTGAAEILLPRPA